MALSREQMIEYGRVLVTHDQQLAQARSLYKDGSFSLDELIQVVVVVTCNIINDREAIFAQKEPVVVNATTTNSTNIKSDDAF
jgi:hypothetical protein